MSTALVITLFIIILPLAFLLARAIYILSTIYTRRIGLHIHNGTLRTVLCIGSGGHTSEMLSLVTRMKMTKYTPRLYIMADTDMISEFKIRSLEDCNRDYEITKIPRSRKVNQPYISSIITTLYAMIFTIPVIYKFKPNLIFCNGPGTCVPICIVAFIFRCLFLIDCRIIYVESVCRVRTLSLSGKILQFFADLFVVQWLQLHKACIRSSYYGRLT